MSVDRRKSTRTQRYELGFQLRIEWCVRASLWCAAILVALGVGECSANAEAYQEEARGNNIQVINQDPFLMADKIHRIVADLKNGRFRLRDELKEEAATARTATEPPETTTFEAVDEITTTRDHYTTELVIDTTANHDVDETTLNSKSDLMEIDDQVASDSYRVESNHNFTNSLSWTVKSEKSNAAKSFGDVTKPSHKNKFDIPSAQNNETEEVVTEVQLVSTTTLAPVTKTTESITTTTEDIKVTVSTPSAKTNSTRKNRVKNKKLRAGEKRTKLKNQTVTNSPIVAMRKIDDNINENSTVCSNCTDIIKNVTRTSDGEDVTEATNEDDYNISYEIADFEEELNMIKLKKNATVEPLTFGPVDAIRDFATNIFQSFYERVVPQGLRDIFRRMQEQNERLETYNLRSKEENGGIGQLGRSIIKGLSVPINQLMQGARDYGSLDSNQTFFTGVASGVVSLADSVAESFKDRVKAIYPGTLWCGDGHMAKSAEVGVFFMTDSCCRRHDACKYYILAGDTKYGLTNTGIFTRSHCECDRAFYKCLKKTNSLVSSQIGVTYFSILGPQCFKRDYPIVKCMKRTRVTGQKCEEYQLDYSQPKMWQWFDNETF